MFALVSDGMGAYHVYLQNARHAGVGINMTHSFPQCSVVDLNELMPVTSPNTITFSQTLHFPCLLVLGCGETESVSLRLCV